MSWSLLFQDALPRKRVFLTAVVFTYVWHLFLLTRASAWQPALVASLAWVPAIFLPVWAVWSSLSLLRREETTRPPQGHSRGWQAVLGSLLATTAHLVVFSLLLSLGALFLFQRSVGVSRLLDFLPIPAVDWFAGFFVRGYAAFFFGILVLAALIQFAFLASRYVNYLGHWMTFWIGLMVVWAEIRLAPVVGGWLFWLPDFGFRELVSVGDAFKFHRIYVDSGPYAFALLSAGLAVAASGSVLNWLKASDDSGAQDAPADTRLVEEPPDVESPEEESSGERKNRRVRASTRDKMLLAILGFSFVFAYDIFANSQAVLSHLNQVFLRPAALEVDAGFTRSAPFVQKTGTLSHPSAGVAALSVQGDGDVTIVRAEGDEITVDYTVRTFGFSARRAQEFHDRVLLRFDDARDRLRLVVETPKDAPSEVQSRVRYRIAIPDGLRLDIETGDGLLRMHDLRGVFDITLRSATFQGSELKGPVTVDGTDAEVWLTNIAGDVQVTFDGGIARAHGIEGDLRAQGEYGSISAVDVSGAVQADVLRGTGTFVTIQGPLTVQARMSRIDARDIAGGTEIQGVLSPVWISALKGPVEVESDRGNLRLNLSDAAGWRVEARADGGAIEGDSSLGTVQTQRGRQTLMTESGTAQTPVRLVAKGASIALFREGREEQVQESL